MEHITVLEWRAWLHTSNETFFIGEYRSLVEAKRAAYERLCDSTLFSGTVTAYQVGDVRYMDVRDSPDTLDRAMYTTVQPALLGGA